MISKTIHQALSMSLCAILLVQGVTAQTSPQPSSAAAAPAVAPLTTDQLNALVAPIALYPDALVAQVLAAASYPDQVAFADDWLAQNQNLQGTALTQQVDQQSWDPSVKALTQFPSVLHDLAKNLSWTSSLGQAFTNQQSDVMAAVQVMRARAQAAGTLQSSPQIKVVQQSPQTIVIEPADTSVVYVPQYNPGGRLRYAPFGAGVHAACGRCCRRFFWRGRSDWCSIRRRRLCRGASAAALAGASAHGDVTGAAVAAVETSTTTTTPISTRPSSTETATTTTGTETTTTPITRNNGSRPGEPNGGRNGDHGLIGGNGGVQHQPDGGRNGDHGLIGGNGGVQHQPGDYQHANLLGSAAAALCHERQRKLCPRRGESWPHQHASGSLSTWRSAAASSSAATSRAAAFRCSNRWW